MQKNKKQWIGLISCQEFKVQDKIVKNIEAEKTGTKNPKEIIVVGAHYDTVPDTYEKLDYDSMATVVIGIEKVISEIVQK
ncbi:MAG: hypothetical protein HQK76_17050 [Desulfobacterales bacterium]|nr:hypothetical protein [Desulfobacterales bacterium]